MRVLFIFFCSLICGVAVAGEATLQWVAPTECANKSALSECPTTGYQIDRKLKSETVWSIATTVAPTLTTYVLKNVPPGDNQFRMLTLSNSQVSAPSVVVSKTVESSTPNPPSAVTVN